MCYKVGYVGTSNARGSHGSPDQTSNLEVRSISSGGRAAVRHLSMRNILCVLQSCHEAWMRNNTGDKEDTDSLGYLKSSLPGVQSLL